MAEFNEYETLFAAKAVVKEINSRYKELEDGCKRRLLEEYERDGTDRKRSRLFGSKNAYLTVQEGKPSEHVQKFDVTDIDALNDWMDREKPETDTFASANIAQFAEFWFRMTGECPDGCTYMDYDTDPGKPIVKLVVKEGAVLPELVKQAELSAGVSRLLMEGGDTE